jgi:hypothetical protein
MSIDEFSQTESPPNDLLFLAMAVFYCLQNSGITLSSNLFMSERTFAFYPALDRIEVARHVPDKSEERAWVPVGYFHRSKGRRRQFY